MIFQAQTFLCTAENNAGLNTSSPVALTIATTFHTTSTQRLRQFHKTTWKIINTLETA